jgi:hypothetical protein
MFLDQGTRRGWGVCVTPRPLSTPGKDPVLIVQENGWVSGPIWTGVENLAPIGIRSPDRPARSSVAIPTELPGPLVIFVILLKMATASPVAGLQKRTIIPVIHQFCSHVVALCDAWAHHHLSQRFPNFFQVGTTFISQNVLRTALLLSP